MTFLELIRKSLLTDSSKPRPPGNLLQLVLRGLRSADPQTHTNTKQSEET